MSKTPMKASDPNDLERHVLDPNIAKSEAEWWAKGRLEELEREVERLNKIKSRTEQVKLVQERDALQADNARLREALEAVIPEVAGGNAGLLAYNKCKAALATTTEHSLARIRNQVRKECATAGGPEDSYQDEWFKAKADSAARILAMLEPE